MSKYNLKACKNHQSILKVVVKNPHQNYSVKFQEQYQLLELVGFHLEEMHMKKFALVHPWSNFTALLPFMDPQLHTQWRLNWQNY